MTPHPTLSGRRIIDKTLDFKKKDIDNLYYKSPEIERSVSRGRQKII
jgi:hypothetical protein